MAEEGGGKGIGKLKDAKNVFSSLVEGAKSAVKFLRTGIGIVILKVCLVILIVIFIYILAEVIFDSIARLLGLDSPAANDQRKDAEYLENLANSGYDSMLNADQLTRYYSYEYAVLMDVGEYLEEVGVTTIEKQDDGQIDWEHIDRHDWARLAAHGFATECNYSFDVIADGAWAQANPDYEGNDTPAGEVPKSAPSGEFYYRIVKNEYTNENALMPYFRIIRNDYNLRYFFELDNIPEDDSGVQNSTTDSAAQKTMAQKGINYNIILLKDGSIYGIRIFGVRFRFEAGGIIEVISSTSEQKADEARAAKFIEQYVYPVFYNSTLNIGNVACGGAGATGTHCDLNQTYASRFAEDNSGGSLFFEEKPSTIIYEVSLRSILDRFLPNASLMSSWRLLTTEDGEATESGSIAQDLINDIITVYDCASLSGETKESKLYLLKDVGKITAGLDWSSTALGLLENNTAAAEPVVEKYYDSSSSVNTKFDSYVPKYDTRNTSDYESIVSKEAEKADQSFTGSFADDVIDDVKLAVSHYLQSANATLTTEQMGDINDALNSKLSGLAAPTSDMEPINDIVIYLDGYHNCVLGTWALQHHWGVPQGTPSSAINVTWSNIPMKHCKVTVNGVEMTHNPNLCKSPFIRVSYKIEKGIKTTGVIIHGGTGYYGYQIRGKEALEYDENYTNNYAFAHLESGDIKSTTFKHWEFAWKGKKGDEKSEEAWFVTDAFEGLNCEVDTSNLSLELRIDEYEDGELIATNVPIELNPPVDLDAIVASLDIQPSEIYSLLLDKTVDDSMIFPADEFAIVRDVGSYGGPISDRENGAYAADPTLVEYPSNANISQEASDQIGRETGPESTYTQEYGETIITDQDYLNLKLAGLKTTDEIPCNISAVEQYIYQKIMEAVNSITDAETTMQHYIWDHNKNGVRSWPYHDSWSDVDTGDFIHHSSEEEGWAYKSHGLQLTGLKVNVDLHVIFPTRVSLQPIQQRVIDKIMPAYFVKYANYWAAEKDFHNALKIQGEFKDHANWRYLVTNNSDAQGIKDILSSYKTVKWRCDLFAPIFGSIRKDNSGREADVKLILSEWENVGSTGVGAADHAIRDLYSLIMYSRGIRQDTESYVTDPNAKIDYVSGFEPKMRLNGEPMINQNSYSFLYIPYEILSFDPLVSEKAFWLDRIICTPNDAIYDKTITGTNNGTNEARFRSRLPTFTWQVVDYDLYDETEKLKNGQHTGDHAVYALWLFGDQMSRMLYAISANASTQENTKITQWGGTTTAHTAADLYGRTESERIYSAAFEGKKSIASPRRTMVNEFYGYGYFTYGGVTSKIQAKYISSIGDALLFNGDVEIKEGDTIEIDGVTFSLDSGAELEDVDWETLDAGVEDLSSMDGTGLYFDDTKVKLKLGVRTYTFKGTAAACYAYELYRQAVALKDETGAAAEKVVKNQLEKEMKWQEVRAIAPGVVTAMGGDAVSGFWVKVVHSGATKDVGSVASQDSQATSVSSSYCHMKRWPVVQLGQYVGAGTVLGYEGTTGKSGGFHCHMNIKINDEHLMPVKYLYPFFTPFWYSDKAAETLGETDLDDVAERIGDIQDDALSSNKVFLDSEYFASNRTVFPYGQAVGDGVALNTGVASVYEENQNIAKIPTPAGEPMKQAESTNGGYVKITNYTPQYALVTSTSDLKKEEDGTDFTKLSTESNVKTNLNKPNYSGESLHTDPRFTDVKFMKKVMRNLGRIHGTFTGIMQLFSFTDADIDKVEIWNELMMVIGNPYGVAGVMGNMQSESSFHTTSLNKTYFPDAYKNVTGEEYTEMVDSGTCPAVIYTKGAYGLCQWLSGRQKTLIEYAQEFGVSVSNGALQLNYCISELQSMNVGGVGSLDYYSNEVKNLLKGKKLIDVLQDEDLLLKIGTHSYTGHESIFNSRYAIDQLTDINDKEGALKTIGATVLILHNYECPGGQSPSDEANRSKNSLNILEEMTDFGN